MSAKIENMKKLLFLLALLSAWAWARIPATFDLRVTKLEVSRASGEPMPDRSRIALGDPFKIRVTVRNDGPGRSVPGWIYYAIAKDAHKVVKADKPIPALAPGASVVREFTTRVKEAPGIWVVEGNVEVASPPDKEHANNHIGLYYLSVVPRPETEGK